MVHFTRKEHYNLDDFRQVIEILRHPGGCPWDQEQTHASIRRNFLEETYEVLDASTGTIPMPCARSWGMC